MAFENFPYTDLHNLNLDWVLKELKNFQARLDGIGDEIFNRAKQYTDQQLSTYQQQVNELRQNFLSFQNRVEADILSYKSETAADITLFKGEVRGMLADMQSAINSIYDHIELRISQNNEYLIDELSKNIGDVLVVINPFTGAKVPIQEMVNYLSDLHLTGAATYTEISVAGKTWQEVGAFNATWQQITTEGKSYFNT